MQESRQLIDERTKELREMLRSSSGYQRTVIRPTVITGCKITEGGQIVSDHGPGPVTIVTFIISHRPDDNQREEMEEKARREAEMQAAIA